MHEVNQSKARSRHAMTESGPGVSVACSLDVYRFANTGWASEQVSTVVVPDPRFILNPEPLRFFSGASLAGSLAGSLLPQPTVEVKPISSIPMMNNVRMD